MNMKKVSVICDLQFGSTGKGLIAGYLAERDAPDTVVTAWSMNAGHTYINRDGRKFVHCMLGNGVVSPNLRRVLIGPGSQIGLQKLFDEIVECGDLLQNVFIAIHEHACVIQQRHTDEESGSKIGSTQKGCGAAMIEKIRRNPDSKIIARDFADEVEKFANQTGIDIAVVTAGSYSILLDNAQRIQVEGAQGFSLGINSGFYPYVTSRECTPAQIVTDCAIPVGWVTDIIGTARTYPIRVANRFDKYGKMIGWSGPGYFDQREISFKDLGQEVEMTTVTKLPRRIFTFSQAQTQQALRACRPTEVFLNFANYCKDGGHNCMNVINMIAQQIGCGGVKYIGNGPTVADVVEVR